MGPAAANVLLREVEWFAMRDDSTAVDERYHQAVRAVAAHRADAAALIASAAAHDPECVLARCLQGFCAFVLMRRERIQMARAALEKARGASERRDLDGRERLHLMALGQAVAGRMREAAETLGLAVALDPLDLAAIKIEHAFRFMLGDAAGMRASLERAIVAWTPAMADYGYVLGCLAFALEETGAFDSALMAGQRANEHTPDDAWGAHAVAHCYEMTGRPEQGLAWLRECEPAFGAVNNFRHHLDWHQALFCLELGRAGEVLTIYDRKLAQIRRDDFRDLADAASLLARLEIAGISVGGRWRALGEIAAKRSNEANLAFASLHDLLALLASGRKGDGAAMLAVLTREARSDSRTQASVLAQSGVRLAEMLWAWRAGAYACAATLFLEVEPALGRLGGSNAQRDLFWRIAIHSALAAGQREIARSLLDRRRRYYLRPRWAGAFEAELAPSAA